MSDSNTGGYWGWIAAAQSQAKELVGKAQEFAEVASKVTQEQASILAQKAGELRQNYDMEVATSILMNTVGGQVDPTFPRENKSSKPTKMNFNELDLVYITENLVAMAYPFDRSKTNDKDAGNDIDVVAAYLKKKHQDHYMVWNVSEESYDYTKFGDQVLEYKFPGHPAPPLGLLFKICTSVESWLDADESNIAVIHCLTGKGRTAALMACVLTWIGEFTSPMEALQYIADRRGISVEHLTIPSQRRYVQYFSNMLDGVRPRSEPLLLRRVIINSIPIFGTHDGTELTQGCCPYLQLFKNGKLIATATPYIDGDESSSRATAASATGRDPKMQLKWINASEGSVSFTLDCAIQGDILLRCRHAAASGTRVSMFRAGFHTGYVPSGVLRLTKAQLDGSSADPRYDDNFFIDLIFAPIVRAAPGSEIQVNSSASVPSSSSSGGAGGDSEAAVLHGTSTQAITDSGLVIDATSTDKYEMSLHKDVRFWETIATRKTRSKRRKSRKFLSSQQEQFSIGDDIKGGGSGTGGAGGAGTETEVDFLAVSAAAAMSKPSASASSVAGLSDSDLILQLAQLEGGDNGSEMVSAGSGSISDQGVDSDDFTLIGKTGSRKSTVGVVTPVVKAASELQALEELEKELGLDDMQLFSGAKSSATGTATGSANTSASVTPAPKSTAGSVQQTPAKKSIADDDNMDELEQYLLSLSTPSAK